MPLLGDVSLTPRSVVKSLRRLLSAVDLTFRLYVVLKT